jgi:hypothetical protein
MDSLLHRLLIVSLSPLASPLWLLPSILREVRLSQDLSSVLTMGPPPHDSHRLGCSLSSCFFHVAHHFLLYSVPPSFLRLSVPCSKMDEQGTAEEGLAYSPQPCSKTVHDGRGLYAASRARDVTKPDAASTCDRIELFSM